MIAFFECPGHSCAERSGTGRIGVPFLEKGRVRKVEG